MGAWIEIGSGIVSSVWVLPVAPYVGAWIEISGSCVSNTSWYRVAPYVGAWIEIKKRTLSATTSVTSHPMWVRGLKYIIACASGGIPKSHPMWVRGLKSLKVIFSTTPSAVAPYVGAWIEISYAIGFKSSL